MRPRTAPLGALPLIGILAAVLIATVLGAQAPPEAPTAPAGTPPQEPSAPSAATPGAAPSEQSAPALPEEPELPAMELTLQDAIRLALGYNLDLRVDRLSEDRIRREERIADAAFDPLFRTSYNLARFRQPSVSFLDFGSTTSTISVNPFEADQWDVGISGLLKTGTSYSIVAGGTRGDNPDSSIFSLNPRYSSSVELQLTQPLLRGFGDDTVLTDLRVASRDAEISNLELRARIEDTCVSVANAYWDLLFARKDLDVKEQALLEAQELLAINQRKLDVGSGTEIDVIDAEANIETQRAGIIDARNARENSQDTLLDLINAPQHRQGGLENPLFIQVEIVPTTEPNLEDVELSLADSVKRAMEQRTEVEQSVLSIQNREDLLDRAEDDVLPRLDLTGSWANSGLEEDFSGSWEELGSGTYYDWSVGVLFEVPLGNRAARERRAQARIDRASARLEQQRVINSVVLGVTQAVRDVRSAQQRLQTTRAATRLRQEQLDGEKRRLQVGASTSYQVLQIQNDLLEAQTSEVQSTVALLKAMTSYRKQTGDVLTVLGIEVP